MQLIKIKPDPRFKLKLLTAKFTANAESPIIRKSVHCTYQLNENQRSAFEFYFQPVFPHIFIEDLEEEMEYLFLINLN